MDWNQYEHANSPLFQYIGHTDLIYLSSAHTHTHTHTQTLSHLSVIPIPHVCSNWNCKLDTLHLVSLDFCERKVPWDVLEIFHQLVRAVLLTVIPLSDYECNFPTVIPPASWEGPIWYKLRPTSCVLEQIKCITATYSDYIFIWLDHKMPIKGRITLK